MLSMDYSSDSHNKYCNNKLFPHYGTFPNSSLFVITGYDNVENETIKNDTIIYVTKRELVDESAWETMMEAINN